MVELVSDLMTRDVVTLDRNDQLSIADTIMNLARIRHMPVLDEDGRLVGILSQRDLFRGALACALGFGKLAQQRIMNSLLIKEVMTAEPLTTTPQTTLAQAAQLMAERKIGCLPVIEGGKLVGILTEGDFVNFFAQR